MSKKILILTTLVLVIILSGLFFLSNNSKQDLIRAQILDSQTQANPTPQPKIETPDINSQTDLKEELQKLTPSDFSDEFKVLKEEI